MQKVKAVLISFVKRCMYRLSASLSRVALDLSSLKGSPASAIIRRCITPQTPTNYRREVYLGTIRSRGVLDRPRETHSYSGNKSLTIFGSGVSLSMLSDTDINLIQCGHTMTFNLSLLLPIRVDYHVIQCPLVKGRNAAIYEDQFWHDYIELTQAVISEDRERFAHTNFLLRTSRTIPSLGVEPGIGRWLAKNGIHFSDLPLIYLPKPLPRSVGELTSDYLEVIGGMIPGRVPLLKLGSSLPTMILLAATLGYKRICLVGCDFSGLSHFYDNTLYRDLWNRDGRFPGIWSSSETFNYAEVMEVSRLGTSQLQDVVDLISTLELQLDIEFRTLNKRDESILDLPEATSDFFG